MYFQIMHDNHSDAYTICYIFSPNSTLQQGDKKKRKSLALKVTTNIDMKIEDEDNKYKINEDMEIMFQKFIRYGKQSLKLHKQC